MFCVQVWDGKGYFPRQMEKTFIDAHLASKKNKLLVLSVHVRKEATMNCLIPDFDSKLLFRERDLPCYNITRLTE